MLCLKLWFLVACWQIARCRPFFRLLATAASLVLCGNVVWQAGILPREVSSGTTTVVALPCSLGRSVGLRSADSARQEWLAAGAGDPYRRASSGAASRAMVRRSSQRYLGKTCCQATRGSLRSSAPLCKFGVIGDIQYADCEDGTDFLGIKPRYFRHTLELVRDAVQRWTLEDKVDFAVQMGDAIDGRNAGMGRSREALDSVLAAFPEDLPRLDLLGNHELYNFQRADLLDTGLHLWGQGLPGVETSGPVDAAGEECYCNFSADKTGRWEIICLDAYDIACVGYDERHPRRLAAETLLARNNPRVFTQGVDWFKDVPVEKHRYVPYNGGLGQTQLDWLRERLRVCMEEDRKVIILTHIPILEESTTPKTMLWNAEEVLQVLRSEDGRCIVAVLAGHDHDGGYAVDTISGIHHVTFLSPLICAAGSGYTGAATVECYANHVEIVGHGVFSAESGTGAMGFPFTKLKLARTDPRGW